MFDKETYNKEYQLKNKERIRKQRAEYYQKNKEQVRNAATEYYQKNAVRQIQWQKEYYKKNKVKIASKQKQYNKEYRIKNKEKVSKYAAKMYQRHKSKINLQRKNRINFDSTIRLKRNLSRRILLAVTSKGWKKTNKTRDILGAELQEVRAYLEAKFTDGMTWENQGKWHIDHIIPLASAKTPEELYKLCHYTNLQPLWAFDNLSKGAYLVNKQL